MANRLSPYFGNYPAEYNRAIHGPYVPTRYYGPRKFFLFMQKQTQINDFKYRIE